MEPVTPNSVGYEFSAIYFDGEPIDLAGVNPWDFVWQEFRGRPLVVPNPSYPGQRHKLDLYSIQTNGGLVQFAAGEVSAGVWVFYLRSPS
jgi:hypothetical protein